MNKKDKKLAICPNCVKVHLKWDWCGDTFYLYDENNNLISEAQKEEVILADKTLTLYTCRCGCLFSVDCNTHDSDMHLLHHESLDGVDWELDENSHGK